jgi:hypothetical protein
VRKMDSEITTMILILVVLTVAVPGGMWYNIQADHQNCLAEPKDTYIQTIQIYSLADNGGVSGSFILGSGSVHTDPVFAGYTKQNDGSFRLITFRAAESVVYQDLEQNSTGYAEEHYLLRCAYIFPFNSVWIHSTEYRIHIPKGSIVQTFKLDSEL